MQANPPSDEKGDVGPHMQHDFRSKAKAAIKAAKGKGKGKKNVSICKGGKATASKHDGDDEHVPASMPRPKAKAKAKAKAKSGKATAKAMVTPVKKRRGKPALSPRMNSEGLPLGCPTCRYAPPVEIMWMQHLI